MQGSDNKWTKTKDEDLRPWLQNEEYEEKISKERADLADTITRTSYSRCAGSVGSSILDPRAPELDATAALCDQIAEQEELLYQFAPQSDMMDGQEGFDSGDNNGEDDGTDQDKEPTDDDAEAEDDFGEGGVNFNPTPAGRVLYTKSAYPAIANISTAQYRKILKSMQENNCSTLNVGKTDVDARKLIKILPKQFTGKKLHLGDSVDAMTALVVTHKAGTRLGEFIDRDRAPTTLGAVVPGMPTDKDTGLPICEGGGSHGCCRKKPPSRSLNGGGKDHQGLMMTGRTGATSVGSDERSTMTADTILYANKRVSETDVLLGKLNRAASVGQHIIHSSRRDEDLSQFSTMDGKNQLPELNLSGVMLNRTNIVPVSPVKSSSSGNNNDDDINNNNSLNRADGGERRPGSSASKSFFMTFLTEDEGTSDTQQQHQNSKKHRKHQPLDPRPKTSARDRAVNHASTNNNPLNMGSLPNTPGRGDISARRTGTSVSRPSTSSGAMSHSATLNKMAISTDLGTAKPESFSHRRISQVRTLRDQLMTSAGRDSMSARLALLEDRGDYGGDAGFFKTLSAGSPTSAKTFTAERLATQKMVDETKFKNSVDQTWPMFVTPGFEEVVGVDNVYMSHTKRTHSPPTRENRARQISQV